MTSLPAPRPFLTSLINTISAIPLPSQQQPDLPHHRPQLHDASTNPLKSVPPQYRPLLTTLHVLFPSLLLPALDLLDRRLVTRLCLVPKRSYEVRYESPESSDEDGEQGDGDRDDEDPDGNRDGDMDVERLEEQEQEQEEEHVERGVYIPERAAPGLHRRRSAPPPEEEEGEQDQDPISHIYTVKSSQSSHPRRRKEVLLGGLAEDPTQKVYIVRLTAWNCTCASFTFAAFPGAGSRAFTAAAEAADVPGGEAKGAEGRGDGGKGEWEVGGVSLDGTGTDRGGVPCCKHLLACLLAERWAAGLGRYVEERRVGRNEMAGIVADI